jgi:hypothetical protein
MGVLGEAILSSMDLHCKGVYAPNNGKVFFSVYHQTILRYYNHLLEAKKIYQPFD